MRTGNGINYQLNCEAGDKLLSDVAIATPRGDVTLLLTRAHPEDDSPSWC